MHEELSSGRWSVGAQIPSESQLAEDLQVSRSVIREAIRGMVQLGLLESRHGSGTFVRTVADPTPILDYMTIAEVREIFEVQAGFDVQAARLAATRRSASELAGLRELLDKRNAAELNRTDPLGFATADSAFHLAVAEAAHNPLLLELYRYFVTRLREALYRAHSDPEIPDCGPGVHDDLVAAIAAQDPEAAARAAQQVMQPTIEELQGRGV
ncbi:FadR family transcriptional regulator [Pseudonocardiaceae bacterium YIM PH 21723]|nr:FadR family transcriptional regulator [Pseudonocardiaceae bacterium YIM PH 21723]